MVKNIGLDSVFKLLLIISLCFPLKHGISQKASFKNASLVELVQQLESKSGYLFNYDPELLTKYTFSGIINWDNPRKVIQDIFYDTPLDHSIDGQRVLVFLESPKKWKVCGYVYDQQTNLPLSYANVYAPNLKTGSQSDEQGYFEFFYTAYKNERIQLSFIGYETQEHQLQTFDTLNCSQFIMASDPSVFVHPVVITDYIIDGISEGSSYSAVDLNYQQIGNWYTNIEQDVLKMVQFIPGITSINESAGDIQIRGSTIDQNLILWEGATLYGPGHLFGSISSINPFVIDEIKVYKGIFDPSYANRVGGIIDLSLSDDIPDKIIGGIGTTLSEAHANLNIPIITDKLSLTVSGRNTINSVLESPTLERFSNKIFQNTKVEELRADEVADEELNYYDRNVKINFRPNDQWHLKASYFNSFNDFKFGALIGEEGELRSLDDVESKTEAFSALARWEWAEGKKASLNVSRSTYTNNYNFSIIRRSDELKLEENQVFNAIEEWAVSLKQDFDLSPKEHLQLGYEFNSKEVNFDRDFTEQFDEPFSENNFIEGTFHNLFSAYEFQTEKSQLNLGLRSIYYQQTQSWAFSPRLNFQHQINEQLKWKFSAGILQQYINQLREFGDTELPLNNRVWVINRNEEEDSQTARKIATGFVFKHKGWLLDLESYFHQTEGLNTLSPVLGVSSDFTGITTGSSRNFGLDVLLKKSWTNYQLWANYSWSKVRFTFPEIQEASFPGTNDLRHNLSLLGTYRWKNWGLSLLYQFRSSLPFSDVDGVLQFEEEDEEDAFYYELDYSGINNGRLNSYQRLDLGINYQFKFSEETKLELAFSYLNLLNRDNLFSREFFIDFVDEEDEVPGFFSNERFLLARTPQLLVRFSW